MQYFKNRTKTITYTKQSGKQIKCSYQFKDEILYGNDIFEGLFYKFVLELRHIGGKLHEFIYKNLNNVEAIQEIYNNLFESDKYPEAKIIWKAPISENYCEFINENRKHFYLQHKIHKAVKKGQLDKLKKLLESDENLINIIKQNFFILISGMK